MQLPDLRISCVHADIDQVLSQPEYEDLNPGSISASEKVSGQKQREQDLHQGSPGCMNEIAQKSEEKMPCFVNNQISIVDQCIMVPRKDKIEGKGEQKS